MAPGCEHVPLLSIQQVLEAVFGAVLVEKALAVNGEGTKQVATAQTTLRLNRFPETMLLAVVTDERLNSRPLVETSIVVQ
jgi:hypothetical protein